MKFIIISVFICLILANLWTIDAYPNKKPIDRALLRQKLIDYLMEARREMLFGDNEDDLRYSPYGSKSDNDDEAGRTLSRRKAVGLGDNPFK